MRFILSGLIGLLISQNTFAVSCYRRVIDSTVGIFNGNNWGASGTIIEIESQAPGASLTPETTLTVYTDKHVIQGVCPGIRQGGNCNPILRMEPTGCPAFTGQLSVGLIGQSESSNEDAAVLKIHVPEDNPALPCLAALERTGTASSGRPALRVGYGGGKKGVRSGHIAGYVDTIRLIPFDGRPGPKLVTTAAIVPGDCGGPVVDLGTCQLLATSQIGPIRGKSLDIAISYHDSLRVGIDPPREQIAKRLPVEDDETVMSRQFK